jgi:hypothetical protein
MFTDGRSPGVARLLGRAVLQLQQMLEDYARGVQNAGLLGSPQRLDLLDQVVEIQRLELPLAQQRGLRLGPDVEVLVVQVLGFGPDPRCHRNFPSSISKAKGYQEMGRLLEGVAPSGHQSAVI